MDEQERYKKIAELIHELAKTIDSEDFSELQLEIVTLFADIGVLDEAEHEAVYNIIKNKQ